MNRRILAAGIVAGLFASSSFATTHALLPAAPNDMVPVALQAASPAAGTGTAEGLQQLAHFGADGVVTGKEHIGVEVALQRYLVAHAAARSTLTLRGPGSTSASF